jgi:adenosylcobyric acid synthase
MLGESVADPLGVEGEAGESRGLGLLPARTRLAGDKVTLRVRAENMALPFLPPGAPVEGYEIHMGRTDLPADAVPALRMRGDGSSRPEGCVAPALPVWGCYLHGIFDSAAVRAGLRDWILDRKGLPAAARAAPAAPDPCERLADWLESHAPFVRSWAKGASS